jgi:hypothetical protein
VLAVASPHVRTTRPSPDQPTPPDRVRTCGLVGSKLPTLRYFFCGNLGNPGASAVQQADQRRVQDPERQPLGQSAEFLAAFASTAPPVAAQAA